MEQHMSMSATWSYSHSYHLAPMMTQLSPGCHVTSLVMLTGTSSTYRCGGETANMDNTEDWAHPALLLLIIVTYTRISALVRHLQHVCKQHRQQLQCFQEVFLRSRSETLMFHCNVALKQL